MSPFARSALVAAVAVLPALAADARADEPPSPERAAATAHADAPLQGTPPLRVARAYQPAAQPGIGRPAPTPAPPPPAPTQPAAEAEGDDVEAGPNWVIGIAGLAVGIAAFGTSVGLLAAAVDRRDEAAEIRTEIKEDPAYLMHSNQCGETPAGSDLTPHPRCDDLAAAADDHAAFTAAGFLLLMAGSSLTLGSALYLSVGGGEAEEDDDESEAALQISPVLGPSQWGATIGGRF
ncbi:MAG: hypothetical protein JRI68_11825 [Deltaproteobacteria bacterium]|nr:hypothetical protein [Deltaproteobacteria bacterium]